VFVVGKVKPLQKGKTPAPPDEHQAPLFYDWLQLEVLDVCAPQQKIEGGITLLF